ncbi:glycosyltransferase involved in cell wall biosynthesis [Prosthecobacter fusiformis]|uniref:Glycosyltransferase involved in cell wall biosynthesis n=2 Tax=Prosthecobacter fusiformis TaxID=48464 RepID=A0A4R7S305_9BACT|nr:glycosyltransferase involved in cell wall biosynthesis [Prosthecobacter fusiformis]
MRRWLRENSNADIIFVPTVLVHHLLGWWLLAQGTLKESQTTILLFFPNTPVKLGPTGKGFLPTDPTSRLFGWLIKKLATAVKEKRVILGAETRSMQQALEEATGVAFVYLPHPVPNFATLDSSERPLTMAVYGPARHEKGSDILQEAIEKHLITFPESKTRFVIQWLGDFHDDEGRLVQKSQTLEADVRVEYVTSYFEPGEYARRLGQTDLLLLPYRCSSYDLRVSRVVIEAMVHGIPVIATRGTTLEEQAQIHGACIPCEDGCAESLQKAIAQAEQNICALRSLAQERAPMAREHFSVKHFRDLLLHKIPDGTGVHPLSLETQ